MLVVNFIVTLTLSLTAVAEEKILRSSGEFCVLPDALPIDGADYSKGDSKDEKKLCAYDFSATEAVEGTEPVALCPKLFSSFPAVELMEIPEGQTKAEFESELCNEKIGQKNRKSKKLAKYKYSMSCSKTPSILGYYHVSRVLGINNVPVAVLRTMAKNIHLDIAEKGYNYTKSTSGELIAKNWKAVLSLINNSSSDITIENGSYTIGALAENPRSEQKYYGDFYPGAGGNDGVIKFKNTKLYKKIATNTPVSKMVGNELTTANYTFIRQMKDATDMIVLDTLFGQQDRFGNIHSTHSFLVRSNDQLEKWSLKDVENMIKENGTEDEKKNFKAAKDLPNDWRKEIEKRNTLLVSAASSYLSRNTIPFAHAQEIMLKDNDCGLKGSNVFITHKLIENVKHISKETYAQLLKLHAKVSTGELDEHLSRTWLLSTQNDDKSEMAQFKRGLDYVVNSLKKNCEKGELHLDLNIKDHFSGQDAQSISCASLQ